MNWQDLIDRMENEPAAFWGGVASLVIAIYLFLNPAGDKTSLITSAITVLGPIIAGLLIRRKVSPVE